MVNLINILAVLMMITSLGVFSLRKYALSIKMYCFQTAILVSIFLCLYFKYDAKELLIWSVTAFLIKVIFVPWFLLRLVKRIGVKNEVEPIGGFFVSPIIALSFSLAVSMMLYRVFMEFSIFKEIISMFGASFIFMMGIFGFILRNSFIKHILSYCLFENGIHLSLALMAYNAHEVVEVGMLTDAVFAVVIMSILAKRYYKVYETLDISQAINLKG